jgi:hypothetical protein
MNRILAHLLLVAVIVVAVGTPGRQAQAEPYGPAQKTSAALDVLDAWLKTKTTGAKWNVYLRSADLRAQIAAGESADPAVLREIQAKYERDARYLKLPEFIAVRNAIGAWLTHLALPKPADLPAAVRAAKGTFAAPDPASLQSAKAALAKATKDLVAYIQAAQYRKGWTKFLLLDELQAQLAAETPDPAILGAVAFQFATGHRGLERPIYANVAKALDAYLPQLIVALEPMAQADFEARLDRLAGLLEAYSAAPTTDAGRAIGDELSALEARGQALDLVAAVRGVWSRPNFLMQASEFTVGAGIARDVNEPTSISENILGTDVYGSGQTTGAVTVALSPNAERAAFDVLFKGRTRSNTTGHNSGATIWSQGQTEFDAWKRTYIDRGGLSATPASAVAHTHSDVQGVDSGRHGLFANKAAQIAWSRVYQRKPASEQESGRLAGIRVRQRMDRDGARRYSDANARLDREFRRPMMDKGAFPLVLDFSTTADDLYLLAVQATPGQLGAPNAPPAIVDGSDFSTRVHESAVENYAQSIWGGESLDNEEFKEKVIRFSSEEEYNRRYPPEENEGSWEMTFAPVNPISVRFSDGGYTLTMRIIRFKGNQTFTQPMNVTVRYKLEPFGTGIKSTREGDIEIFPPDFQPGGDQVLTPAQVTLKRQLYNRFSRSFREEETSNGLLLPGEWKKAGRLALLQLSSDGGWLTTAWQKPETPIPDEAPADPAPAPPAPAEEEAPAAEATGVGAAPN